MHSFIFPQNEIAEVEQLSPINRTPKEEGKLSNINRLFSINLGSLIKLNQAFGTFLNDNSGSGTGRRSSKYSKTMLNSSFSNRSMTKDRPSVSAPKISLFKKRQTGGGFENLLNMLDELN